ncbi:MAG: hypothetical protein LBH03_05835 [Holophagales bacterium]|jgi:hypothetical protein|nr:hypothetical protein [Holophagales bacterium]
MILNATFLLLQAVQAQPPQLPKSQVDELRIVAVEQTGKPPYEPDGRVYRLTGKSASRIKPGEVLIIKRPKEPRDIGLLRVVSVQADMVTAKLEVKGEAFPLKGDLVLPLASLEIPTIANENRHDRFPLRAGIPFPLTPSRLPNTPYGAKSGASLKDIPFPLTLLGIPSIPSNGGIQQARTLLPPSSAKSLEEIIAGWPATKSVTVAQPPTKTKIVEKKPFYFLSDSAELSEKGLEKLKQWTEDWGKKDVKWILAVPQSQLKFEKILAARMTALQNELYRLGIVDIGFMVIYEYIEEPYDVVYVGVERLL